MRQKFPCAKAWKAKQCCRSVPAVGRHVAEYLHQHIIRQADRAQLAVRHSGRHSCVIADARR